MDLMEFGKSIAKLGLPLLGAALPVPGGAVLGAALARAIGSESDRPEDLLATLAGNPEALQKARQFEAEHQERMLDLVQKHDLATYQAEIADRQSARERDVELAWAGRGNRRADVMVALDVAGLVACLVAIVWLRSSLTGEAITLITTLAGYFGLSLRDAHQFEFGSSRGSKDKDALLLAATPTKAG